MSTKTTEPDQHTQLQTNVNYLLIGNGKVARHLRHYLSFLKLPFTTWDRDQDELILVKHAKQATHILFLISDNAIEHFIVENKYLFNSRALLIHFSGSLVSKLAIGAHPLMTVSESFFTLEEYKAICFIVENNAPTFDILLPGLPNQNYPIATDNKAYYHALCVLSGNFSCMLWQKLFTELREHFNFPEKVARSYLNNHTFNLLMNYKTALTGPLVRNDQKTIDKNLQALKDDPFQEIYQKFVECYAEMKKIGEFI